MIKLTNTLGMQKELLVPVKESKIGMYVCGVTVYDLCHLGHARTFVAFDMIVRYLRFRGYDVTFVRNITDIDDKIILIIVKSNIVEEFINLKITSTKIIFINITKKVLI